MCPRPRKLRFCREFSGATFYKPQGIPLSMMDINSVNAEELEAFRLCDLEDMEQEQAAKKMKISRATLQRDLYSARKKIADALINSKAIRIDGGKGA
jgi:uncharacterized protein